MRNEFIDNFDKILNKYNISDSTYDINLLYKNHTEFLKFHNEFKNYFMNFNLNYLKCLLDVIQIRKLSNNSIINNENIISNLN